MKHPKLSILGTIVCLFAMLIGCKKYNPNKIVSTAWNPNVAIPVAFANFDVYDVLAKTDSNDIVIIDPNSGQIALVYRGEIASYNAQDVVQLSDFSTTPHFTNTDFGLSIGIPFSGNVTSNITTNVNPTVNNGVELHQVNFKNGTMAIDISCDLRHNVDVQITIPDMKENGIAVVRNVNLNYTGTLPMTSTFSIDLADVVLDFTKGGTTFNAFEIQNDISINGTGEIITGTESCDLTYSFTNLDFRNAQGYFGQQSVGVDQDSVLLRIFDNNPDGYFELVDPRVRFTVANSFGFPIELDFQDLKTIEEVTGVEHLLAGYPNPFQVLAPTVMGQTAISILELNTANTTNIQAIISPTPKYFYFGAIGTSNPLGNVALNFIEDTSKFVVDAEIEMPLEGFAYGFTVSDTVAFSFTENVENIESLMFRINITNGFPVDLTANISVLDSNKNVLFVLNATSNHVVESGLIDANGRVVTPTQKITDFTLSKAEINLLQQAKHILIQGDAESLNGPNGTIVKIFDTYAIDVKIGMQVQGTINL